MLKYFIVVVCLKIVKMLARGRGEGIFVFVEDGEYRVIVVYRKIFEVFSFCFMVFVINSLVFGF